MGTRDGSSQDSDAGWALLEFTPDLGLVSGQSCLAFLGRIH